MAILGTGSLRENLLTNSGFDVWSNSTLEVAATPLDETGSSAFSGAGGDTPPSGWTNNVGSSVDYELEGDGGTLNLQAEGSSPQGARINISLTIGKLYRIRVVMAQVSGGGMQFYGGTTWPTIGSSYFYFDGAGTYSKIIEATSPSMGVYMRVPGYAVGTFDELAIEEVTPGCGADLAPDGWGNGTSTGLLTMRREHDGSNTKEGSFYALRANWTNTNSNYAISQDLGAAGTLERFQGRTVTFGCWIKTAAGVNGYIAIHDSAGVTNSAVNASSSYAWVEVTRDIATSVTSMSVALYHTGNTNPTTIYFSQPMLVFGSSIGAGNYSRPVGEIIWFKKVVQLTDYAGSTTVSSNTGALDIEAQSNGKIPKGAKAINVSLVGSADGDSESLYTYDGSDTDLRGTWALTQSPDGYVSSTGFQQCDNNGDFGIGIDATYAGVRLRCTGVELR